MFLKNGIYTYIHSNRNVKKINEIFSLFFNITYLFEKNIEIIFVVFTLGVINFH